MILGRTSGLIGSRSNSLIQRSTFMIAQSEWALPPAMDARQ
jgi:hypothetical protein